MKENHKVIEELSKIEDGFHKAVMTELRCDEATGIR